MRRALVSSLRDLTLSAPRGTISALAKRDICTADGTLTPAGRVVAISEAPLAQQCEAISVPLDVRRHEWTGRAEDAAALLFPDAVWVFADEGRMLHALIHALVLPRVYTLACSVWNDPDRARSYLYSSYGAYLEFLEHDAGITDGMLADIRRFDRTDFARSWETLASWNSIFSHPARFVSAESALGVLDGVGEPRLSAIAEKLFSEPYAYFRGWPDLMLMTVDRRLRFVEVKTSDTLHFGQIVTITDMRAAAGIDVSVLQLVRQRRANRLKAHSPNGSA